MFAVAATVGHGLALSLEAGMNFTKKLIAKEKLEQLKLQCNFLHLLSLLLLLSISQRESIDETVIVIFKLKLPNFSSLFKA